MWTISINFKFYPTSNLNQDDSDLSGATTSKYSLHFDSRCIIATFFGTGLSNTIFMEEVIFKLYDEVSNHSLDILCFIKILIIYSVFS